MAFITHDRPGGAACRAPNVVQEQRLTLVWDRIPRVLGATVFLEGVPVSEYSAALEQSTLAVRREESESDDRRWPRRYVLASLRKRLLNLCRI